MYCNKCKKDVEPIWEVPYMRCPFCGNKLEKQKVHIQMMLGNQEITRRSVEDMYNEGLISKEDYR